MSPAPVRRKHRQKKCAAGSKVSAQPGSSDPTPWPPAASAFPRSRLALRRSRSRRPAQRPRRGAARSATPRRPAARLRWLWAGAGWGAHLGSDIRPGPATHRGCYGPAATPRPVHRRRGSEGSRACAPSQPAQRLCQAPNGAAEVAPARSQDARAASAARCVLGSRTPRSRIARPVHAKGAAAGRGPDGRVPQVVTSQDMVTACLWAH